MAIATCGLVLLFVVSIGIFAQPLNQTVRKNVLNLSPQELQAYRDAVFATMNSGTYNNIASDHGDDKYYCPHSNFAFLPWHRRYIRRMEAALGGPIPYWDWTAGGIPAAFTDAKYTSAQGRVQDNPLRSGFLRNSRTRTTRALVGSFGFQALRRQIAAANSQLQFEQFSQFLESAHNTVHATIGASMGSVSTAAFDPIFWSHHMNVDRVWWLWQRSNPDVEYPADALDTLLDSDGEFAGSDMVTFFDDWNRGPRLLNAPSIVLHQSHMILVVHNVPMTYEPAQILVTSMNVTLGTAWNFGMAGTREKLVNKDSSMVATEAYLKLLAAGNTDAEIIAGAKVQLLNVATNVVTPLTNATVDFTWTDI